MKDTSTTIFWKIELEKPVFFTLIFYLAIITVVEIFSYKINPVIVAILNALLILFAINQAVWMRTTASYRILPTIALVPFSRLLSIVVPVRELPLQINYVLVTVPLLVTVWLMTYYRKIPLIDFGIVRPVWRSQLPITLSGLPLGIIAFLILRPRLLFAGSDLVLLIANLLVVFICVAFAEEVVFRGVILRAMVEVNEQFALLVSGGLYGILNIGSHSLGYAIFMGLVGWLFAFLVRRTGSIWGVVGAHFLLITTMGLVLPRLF